MDDKTKGAWIIHHARKLQTVASQDFDQLSFSGKCGLLLSGIAASDQGVMPMKRVIALARANNISPKLELRSILDELKRQKLIDYSEDTVEVLGLTTYMVLGYTATIFEESSPDVTENAAIEISESVSAAPAIDKELLEYAGDTFHIASSDAQRLLESGKLIGFFDAEADQRGNQIIFNGNLFRAEDVQKVNIVLSSISASDSAKVNELNAYLATQGCISLEQAQKVLGQTLFSKLHSIGMYDVSRIGNEYGTHYFVTRPAAFSKFTSSIADDAFDLAKAFVSALTYGMTASPHNRGRIQMIAALMEKLIRGEWIGPATAIGHDYQALELRGVVEVRATTGSMYYMRLLKPEVGKLALSVIQEGEAASEVLTQLPSAAVSDYIDPETNRTVVRKQVSEPLKSSVGALLDDIRTGRLSR